MILEKMSDLSFNFILLSWCVPVRPEPKRLGSCQQWYSMVDAYASDRWCASGFSKQIRVFVKELLQWRRKRLLFNKFRSIQSIKLDHTPNIIVP